MITATMNDYENYTVIDKELDTGALANEIGTVLDTVSIEYDNGRIILFVNGTEVPVPQGSSDWAIFINNENYSKG